MLRRFDTPGYKRNHVHSSQLRMRYLSPKFVVFRVRVKFILRELS
jgi:hypothetical protein